MRTTPSKKHGSAPEKEDAAEFFRAPPGSKLVVATTVEEAIDALGKGPADGYVVLDAKTFRETVNAIRREGGADGPAGTSDRAMRFVPEHLDILFGELTRTQQIFLLQLLRKPGCLVPRGDMLAAIRGGDGTESRRTHSLNQVAHVLRKRLGRAGRCIETVHGVGFRWNRSLESGALSFGFLKVAGLAVMCTLAVVAGSLHFAFRDHGDGGWLAGMPFWSMRDLSPSYSVGEPSASVGYADGHSPWRAADGDEETWFESEGPARAGDWLAFRFPKPLERTAETASARRVEILFGRPGAVDPPLAPPCRVECSDDPFFAPDSWRPAGNVDPATGRFVLPFADLPAASVWSVRVVVAADADVPLCVREACIAPAPAE